MAQVPLILNERVVGWLDRRRNRLGREDDRTERHDTDQHGRREKRQGEATGHSDAPRALRDAF